MKIFITHLSTSLAIIFLFTSCGSSITVTKRHYNNGYHVSFNKAKHPVKTNNSEITMDLSAESKENTDFDNSLNKSENTPENSISEYLLVEKSTQDEVTPIEKETKKSNDVNTKKSNLDKGESVHQSISKVTKSSFDLKNISPPESREDGLSLLWIIIVVILILWALGLIGGYIGSLIHLLLIIALILLILWLLGII